MTILAGQPSGQVPMQGGPDSLDRALRGARIARVRAEKARRLADVCEHRARHMTNRAPLYLAEAHRLRAAANDHDADVAWHDEAAEAIRDLMGANLM